MSAPRIKVSVEHLRDEIQRYLEVEAADRAEVITEAVRDAVDAFDFTAAVDAICQSELEKFVRESAGVYFRALLKSEDAHAVVRDALRHQLGDEA